MTAPADDAAPIWHSIPIKRRVTAADLPPDGARVVVRGAYLSERMGRWDEKLHEWWGIDWRAAMACATEWRERDGNEHKHDD